ncbi:MAG: SusC/RagA family TonB-linked outer membrane protein, partial [Bacteroidota bacterium]|nr:SusC/RagA family TonB-linked outer membrane protein [Bacteroidota bacterium]
MSQVILNQDLSFITPGLDFKGFFSFDAYNNTRQQRHKKETTYSVDGVDDETGYIVVKEVDKGQEYLGYSTNSTSTRAVELKGQLNYNRLFNDKHRVGGMLMYYQRDYINGSAGSAITSLPYRKQ